MTGSTTEYEPESGEIVHHYDTANEPGERLLVRCRNRRATVCAPCSRLHAGDTFHLVRAGLVGGKHIPDSVRRHPRLFITLTAPGFGPVHRSAGDMPCRPRRGGGYCEHGRPSGCGRVHAPDDPLLGQPLCHGCYDYPGHVLWHSHAGRLWKAFTDNLYHHLAALTGRSRSHLRRSVRISYAKVAEYQRRAAVHVHAVVRLDGADGPGNPPPTWADGDELAAAVRTSVAAVRLHLPYSSALGEHELHWGTQLDVRPLRTATDDRALNDEAVAAYVAKYVSKGAGDTGAGADRRISHPEGIRTAQVTRHVRTLMATCWRLGGLPELTHLRLRAWAHTLGYRGHILTKSRAYSTTYGALRAARVGHHRAGFPGTEKESTWRYVASGHSPGGGLIAAGIATDLATNREAAREALRDGPGGADGAR
ncbi:replication initiator [Streptomyces harbinensis]|uniref:replication initiator n=1 Tax=Streptomyces harbinensis TaxID=1176198 RepID=UPI0033932F1F